jgi:hypothetical protein
MAAKNVYRAQVKEDQANDLLWKYAEWVLFCEVLSQRQQARLTQDLPLKIQTHVVAP